MNKIIKYLLYPAKDIIGIGYSKCGCCHFPWNMVKMHEIDINFYRGCFAVCEDCWKTKSDDEIIKAHVDLYHQWIYGDGRNRPVTSDEIGFTMEEMLDAVKRDLKTRNLKKTKIFETKDYGCGKDLAHYFLFGKEIGRRHGDCYHFFNDRYIGWHDWNFGIYLNECGYDEGYWELHVSLFGWHSLFKTRIKSKRFPDGDCDAPQYGIAIHDNTFWIYRGGNGNMNGGSKWWTWDLPFFSKEQVRHDLQDVNFKFVPYDDVVKKPKWLYPDENDAVFKYHYDYYDKSDGSTVPCTFWVEEREWRPKWLKWTGLFKKVERYIEIKFGGNGIGKDKDDWKGGTIGCSYIMLKGEHPMQTIKRMEKERDF